MPPRRSSRRLRGSGMGRFSLTLMLLLCSAVPVLSQTRAESHEDAVIMAFRRLCVDMFPSAAVFEEMGQSLGWKRTADLSAAGACVGKHGGQINQVINPYLATDFGFPVNLSVIEVREGDDKITTCTVGHPEADPQAVVAGMRKDIGLKESDVFRQNGETKETWAVGRFGKPYRISAIHGQSQGVILQFCDDPTDISPAHR